MTDTTLPDGVLVRPMEPHSDHRGMLCELYRDDWTPMPAFAQWNLVRSSANVLRGVHVHPRHADYLHVMEGELLLGLHDLRPADPGGRTSAFLTLGGGRPTAVFIPPGVCHGFWFPRPTVYVYGLSSGWSPEEELGCRYDDPGLGLDWPAASPLMSPRDVAPAHDYPAMRSAWIAARGREA